MMEHNVGNKMDRGGYTHIIELYLPIKPRLNVAKHSRSDTKGENTHILPWGTLPQNKNLVTEVYDTQL